MELNVFEVPSDKRIQLIGLGDIHIGNINSDKKKFTEIVDWIYADKRRYWLGMGDYIEAILPSGSEWRYDTRTIDPYFWDKYRKDPATDLITEELAYFKYVAKIKDRCLGLHEGNHEYTVWNHHHLPVVPGLCRELNLKYLGPSAFTVLRFPNCKPITIFSLHGDYAGRREGGAINRLHDIALGYDADLYMMGHTHWIHGSRGIVGYIHTNEEVSYKERKKAYVLTGAFLQASRVGSQSYIERKGLQPRKTGIVVISIDPKRHDIHVQG